MNYENEKFKNVTFRMSETSLVRFEEFKEYLASKNMLHSNNEAIAMMINLVHEIYVERESTRV